jgi:hypothetical protein
MISREKLTELAILFDGVTEEPHFEKTSFRVKKKIFVTYDTKTNLASVKLSAVDQASFCSFDKKVMFPVPNKWGQMGWTYIDLNRVKKEILVDALTTAYQEVLKAKGK